MSKPLSSSSFLLETNTTVRSESPAEVRIMFSGSRTTLITAHIEPIPGLTHLLWRSSREDLVGLIRHDLPLVARIEGQYRARLSDLSPDEFTCTCVHTLAPPMLRAIGYFTQVQQWSMTETVVAGMAIDRIVSDLLDHLGLPATRTLACTALVILFIKGLHAPKRADPASKSWLHIRICPRWPFFRIG